MVKVGLVAAAAACQSGGGGPVAPGGDLAVLLLCPVCGVGTYTVEVGQNAQFSARVTSVTTGEDVACSSGTWMSASTNVATVVGFAKSGTVTGVAPGEAEIRVELQCASGAAAAQAEVLVIDE